MAATPIRQQAYTQGTTPTTLMSTELNGMASGATVVGSTILDNTTNLDLYGDFELVCSFGTAPTANSTIDLYLIPSIDGTNYGYDSSSKYVQPQDKVGFFQVEATTASQRLVCRNVPLTPGKMQPILVSNGTGQALAASGNTLRVNTHSLQAG